MMILGVVVFTFLPLLLILILVKSKRIGTVEKILLSVFIVVILLLITEVKLSYIEDFITQQKSIGYS